MYKGTGPNLIDLVAGRTQATSAGTPALLPHVKSGKLRVIAVGSAKRKTPASIIGRLADEAAKAARHPSVAERFAVDSAEAVGSTPKEYGDFIAAEQARWGDVVRKAGVKVN